MEREYWLLTVMGMLSGTIVFGAKIFSDMGLTLYQIVMLPLLFNFVLFPFILFRKEYRIKKEMLWLFIGFGLISTVTALAEVAAVMLGAPVAVAILLIYTQPLWTVIFGRVLLKEKISRYKVLAVITVLLGTAVLVNPFNLLVSGSLSGITVALIGGIALSLWIIFGRIAGKRQYHPVTTQFFRTIFLILFLSLSYPVTLLFVKNSPSLTNFSFNLSIQIWFYFFIYAMVSNVIPHILYFEGVKKVPASTAGIILLLEPVSASLLAAAFLLQPLTLNILIGGALILLSNYLVVRKGS